jgi:hypothetical protein
MQALVASFGFVTGVKKKAALRRAAVGLVGFPHLSQPQYLAFRH